MGDRPLPFDVDAVYVLMFEGWRQELRANRWHYARRWARHVPVVLVQPEQVMARYPAAAIPEPRIERCRILPVKTSLHPATLAADTLVQLGQVTADMAAHGVQRPLLWFYNPYLAGLYAALPAVARVFHASENYFDFQGLPDRFLDLYRLALGISDLVVAVSDGVAAGIRTRGPGVPIEVVSNGCDYGVYAAEGAPDTELVAAAARARARVAIYAGNINARLDFELLATAAHRARATLFAFYGPVRGLDAADTAAWRALLAEPNVRYFGPVDPDRLPALYRAADVGLIPYRATRLMVDNGFPLKALEMAATGLPVVSSPLRPLAGLARALVVAEDRAAFLAALDATSRRTLATADAAALRALAARHDYDAKFAAVLERLAARVASAPATRLDAALAGPLAASWPGFVDRHWRRQARGLARVDRHVVATLAWRLAERVPPRVRAGVPLTVRRALRRGLGL